MTDRETIETLAEKVMGMTPAAAAQLVVWNPLTEANATLECLGRFERWELTEPGACQVWRDGKCFFEYDETPLRSACRAMIAAVEGRDE